MLNKEIANLRPVFNVLPDQSLNEFVKIIAELMGIELPAMLPKMKRSDYITVILNRIDAFTKNPDKDIRLVFEKMANANKIAHQACPGLREQLIQMGKLKDLTNQSN